ncbi:MAG: ATP-grasp domain-containing protein [Candidatus Anammoxibacter sp.]
MMSRSSFKHPAIVSVAAGESQVLLIKKMKELGYAVISIDRNPEAPGFNYSDESLYLGTFESKPITEELDKLKDKYNIRGVFTRSSGPPVVTVAAIADHFNLPGATEKAASVIVNKCGLMNLCQSNGIKTPESQIIDETGYFDLIAKQLPCVIKPAIGLIGKQGVTLVRERDRIDSAFQEAKSASFTGEVLLEKFIPGDDIGLMSVVFEGKVYPVVLLRELNEFGSDGKLLAKGISIPYEPGSRVSQLINDLAQSIVDITGVKYSPFLMSCRYSDDCFPVPIEVHLDFGGDGILDTLLPQSTDFDFIKYVLQVILGIRAPELLEDVHFKFSTIGK